MPYLKNWEFQKPSQQQTSLSEKKFPLLELVRVKYFLAFSWKSWNCKDQGNHRKMMKNADINISSIFCLLQLDSSVAQLVEQLTSKSLQPKSCYSTHSREHMCFGNESWLGFWRLAQNQLLVLSQSSHWNEENNGHKYLAALIFW